ncbi:MAG TPA: hypothetical protein V6D23_00480 [Candidatus Obscuribacterales bacterium]
MSEALNGLTPLWQQHSLDLPDYPFRFGALGQSERLIGTAARSVRLNSAPPALILRSGEVVFISATAREPLAAWADRNGLGQITLRDTWSLLCAPFLDTHYPPEHARHDIETLRLRNFTPTEVTAIQARIAPALLAYNALLQDWTVLGHYDLLLAWREHGPGLDAEFYVWSMEIALRGWGDKL